MPINLSATGHNAVQAITYTFQNNSSSVEKTIPLNSVPAMLSEGRWEVSYYATDINGNVEEAQTQKIQVDGTLPTVSAQIAGAESNGWYPPGTTLTLSASDPLLQDVSAGSVVGKIESSLDGGNTWEQYTGATVFTIADAGVNTIQYRTTDLAGNQSLAQSLVIQIDAQPPARTVSV